MSRRQDSFAKGSASQGPATAVQRLAANAIREHQAGHLEEAKRLYLEVLALDVKHAKSLFGLGLVEYQLGRYDTSARMIQRAIAVDDRTALYHSSLGAALQQLQQLDSAAAAYERALALEPKNEDVHFALGNICLEQKNFAKARTHYGEALRLRPDRADTHCNLGNVYLELGEAEEARACFERALALRPDFVEAETNLGNVDLKQGRLEQAAEHYQRAVTLDPNRAEVHNNLGNALRGLDRIEESVAAYDRALALKPDYANAWNNRGAVLQGLGRLEEAAAAHARAVELNPRDAGAWNNLGVAWREQGQLETAMQCHQRALALDANYAEAHNNLGVVYRDLGRLDEAAACHERAFALKPLYAEAESNLGNVRRSQCRLVEARACYERALALKPDAVDPAWNLCLVDLLEGNFERGWREYEVRKQRKRNAPRVFDAPLWRGEELNGARILLHAEQGLGDTLQFLRYVPMVQARGGRVVLDVQGQLRRLAGELPGLEAVTASGENLGEFAWQCPLMSLPLAFATVMDTIPAAVPYLKVPEEARRAADALPWENGRLRVGLVWSGNPKYSDDRARSVPLAMMNSLFAIEGVRWFSLQLGPAAEKLAESEAPITDLRPAIGDMADTAALVERLDLVITVDTAVAHLAGALARPVWVLLPFAPDWRWLLEREDSPWYPTARLFRQPQPGDWESILERVRTDLTRRAGSHE
ncbi:MAG TPA: tetratricopeptide repeat protein [Acidobacteriaceae bacterium]|nr:tetratricopeptide repeat protein [Acidobacteriaceae bacterium]